MTREDIISYINNPHKLDRDSLDDIHNLAEAFPYFQTAHLLVVKNQYNIRSLKFNESLRSASPRIGDRTILYYLIQDIYTEENTDQEKHDQISGDTGDSSKSWEKPDITLTSPSMDDKDGSDLKADTQEKEEIVVTRSDVTYSFTNWFDHIDQVKGQYLKRTDVHRESLKEDELIDRFIKSQPSIIPKKEKLEEQEDISEAYLESDDNLLTETLAKIYIKQGYYSKAIYAYERLSLKYPEKSSYFATQINKIRQLKDNHNT